MLICKYSQPIILRNHLCKERLVYSNRLMQRERVSQAFNNNDRMIKIVCMVWNWTKLVCLIRIKCLVRSSRNLKRIWICLMRSMLWLTIVDSSRRITSSFIPINHNCLLIHSFSYYHLSQLEEGSMRRYGQ